ncbi:MAG: GNAT family N-acetyltransferase [Planctomycetota bacterium]|jgi:GNAT superfamily N-acetyltransferase
MPPTTPTPPAVAASARLFLDAFTRLIARVPGSRCGPFPGGTVLWSGTPLPFFNFCFLDAPAPDAAALRRHLDAALAYAADEPEPWFDVLCTEWLPAGWQDVVADAGLHVAQPVTGMVADALSPPRRPPPALAMRRVGDEASRRAVAEINRAAYDVPAGMCDCLAGAALWQDDLFGIVGSVDGEDVSTATAYAQGDVLYVAMVATLPDHGRKGYGELVMREALARAGEATGIERTALHASEAGRPVYAAMGYEETAHFVLLSTEAHE